MSTYAIVIAEDDPLQRRTVRRMLEAKLPVEIIEAVDGNSALEYFREDISRRIRLCLLDLNMPGIDGMMVMDQAKKIAPHIPFIVLTGSERVQDAVEAMRLGATDFITKPAQPERLIASVHNALALRDLQEEVKRLQPTHVPEYHFEDILATSPGLHDIIQLGRKAAASDIPVMITGESGVGKEIFALAIHKESKRSDKPFVSVNCGALPDNLVESTLFGHEKGSFTGATARSIGKCREANTGIIFLDEVGELKLDAQVKLLRLLQQGEVEPVGSSKPIKVDVRVISATNRSPERMVAQGHFREDLYYRLHGLAIHIPPLRERRRDIPLLAEHLLRRIALVEQKIAVQLAPEALDWLSRQYWPGNVRELQHLLSRAVLLLEGDTISAAHLERYALKKQATIHRAEEENQLLTVHLQGSDGQLKSLEEIEYEVIDAALARYGQHIGKAAAALGIGQSTLYKRMRKKTA